MRSRTLRFALAMILAVLATSSFAHALPPAIETRVQQAIQDLKNESADGEKDACGQLILVESEIVIEGEKGVTNRPFKTETRDTWGCNSKPGGKVKIGKNFSSNEGTEADGTKKTLVNVVRELNYDSDKSATLEGRVTNKDGKGLRHAKIRLVEVRRGMTFETEGDGEGFYEIQVPSGEYTVTATVDDCSKSSPKELCAFGKITAPASKHGPFRQDFKLDCENLILEITGSSQMKFFKSEDGMTFNGNSTCRIEGQSSLSIDEKTSKVSGEGFMVTLYNDDFVMETIICDDGECHTIDALPGGGRFPDIENRVTVSGKIVQGMADIAVTILPAPLAVDVNIQLDGRDAIQQSVVTNTEENRFYIRLPFSEGSSTPYDFSLSHEGITLDYHCVFSFRNKEGAPPMPRLSQNPSSGTTSPGTTPGPNGDAGNSVASGGGFSGGRTTIIIPRDPGEEDEAEIQLREDEMNQTMGAIHKMIANGNIPDESFDLSEIIDEVPSDE